jgi:hypothetical protein
VPCHGQRLYQRAHIQSNVLGQLEHKPRIYRHGITHATASAAQTDKPGGIATVEVSFCAGTAFVEARDRGLDGDFIPDFETLRVIGRGAYLQDLAAEFVPDCDGHGFASDRMGRGRLRDERWGGVFVH